MDRQKKITSLCIKDGIFWSIMLGVGEAFVNPFVIALSASPSFIGLINSIPLFFGSISQIFVFYLKSLFKNLKSIVLFFVLLQAFVWLAFSYLAFISFNNQSHFEFILELVLVLFTLYFIFGMIPVPFWNTWISNLIDKKNFGKFFSLRNQYLIFFQFAALLFAGFLLKSVFKDKTMLGFSLLFLVAFFARLLSSYFIFLTPDNNKEQEENNTKEENKNSFKFGFRAFLKNANFENYKNLSLFNFFLIFGVYIASPFFDLYMLKVLNFDYLSWSIAVFASGFAKIFAFRYWADGIRIFGQRTILFATSLAASFVPLFWLFISNPFEVFLVNFFTGFVWAGYDLIIFLYLLSPSSENIKIAYSSFFQLLKGLGILLGSISAGFLLGFLENSIEIHYAFFIIFILSAIFRFLAVFLFQKKLDTHPFENYKKILPRMFYQYFFRWVVRKTIFVSEYTLSHVKPLYNKKSIKAIKELMKKPDI
jgi:MFS family permease